MDAMRTYLSPRVARFSKKIMVTALSAGTKAICRASQSGIIFLTFTA